MSNLNKAMNSTPKRRGRKRKQDLLPVENDVSDLKISPDSTSKRGRKRKQINYYELANPGTFETAINNDLSDADDNKAVQPPIVVKPAKIKVSAKLTLNNEKINAENSAKESNGHSKPTVDQHNLDNNFDSANIDSSNEPVLQNNDQDSLSEQPKKAPASSGDKKYNYTGETVKMLSNLFKSFTPKKDEETSNNNVANEKPAENANTKKQSKNKNDEKATNSNSENVVCAVCNQSIEKTLWLHHKQRYHNNLAWRIGDEPLDLSDQSFVMYTLNALYKKKKPLYCDKCGEAKKSVVGFLSHQTTCSKTDAQLDSVKISCELCGKKMLPVSMLTHMKFVHSKKDKQKDEPIKAKNESKSLPSKRSAAKKALKMIETFSKNDSNEESYFSSDFNFESQQFAVDLLNQELEKNQIVECPFKCDFESRELSEIYKHCENCTKKPTEGFACKTCLLIVSSLKEIIYHVESVHNIVVNPENEDEECEKDQKHPSFLQTSILKSEKRICPFAFSWTTKFQNENFSDLLYSNFTQTLSDWPILPASSALDYLPKLAESCDVAQLPINSFVNPLDKQYEFKKYEIFETTQHADHKISIFCGGPVVSMAWLPIPAELEGEDQILAVSVLQSPDEKYSTTKNSQIRSAIQFWNFGRLANKTGFNREPKLVFNLAHNHGPVWHMEWCPSGCYNKEKRMGLLAVTGSDSVVYIYSVPFLAENLGIYYKPVPVMKLMLQRCNNGLLGGTEYYPVKISWTKAKRHSFVAVGYTNGQIAIFNLNTKSVFSKFQDQAGVVCLLPEKNFQAHSHSITILQLHHLNEGCRWLLSGSLDRGVYLWDLEDHNYPVFSARKNIVTAGLWLTHWLCYINGADEGSTSLYVSGALKQMREYITDTSVSLTFSPSSILSMTGSDWLNAVMHGNSAGEIIAVFPHQLLYLQSYTKLWKKKRLLFGYTSLVDKSRTLEERVEDDKKTKKLIQGSAGKQNWSKTAKLSKQSNEIQELLCNEPLVYEEAQKRYGLVFCDNKMETYDDFPESTTNQLTSYSKFLTITKPNQYPMTAINQILFNPNMHSSLYYAAGYQAGFVRISWMQFLKNDTEIH